MLQRAGGWWKPVRKVWADNANQARPEAVTVQLFTNGIARGEAIRLNAANNWQSAWTGLPKAEGGEIRVLWRAPAAV